MILKYLFFLIIFLTDDGVPTSVDFVRCDPSQMVASYTSSNTYIYDLETAKQILCLETKINIGKYCFHSFILPFY